MQFSLWSSFHYKSCNWILFIQPLFFHIRLTLLMFRSRGPLECESLQNDVSINCLKTEEKILNTWYPRVINLFTRKEALEGVKHDKIDSFYNCVATLMSNQVKKFKSPWGDCYNHNPHVCPSTALSFLCFSIHFNRGLIQNMSAVPELFSLMPLFRFWEAVAPFHVFFISTRPAFLKNKNHNLTLKTSTEICLHYFNFKISTIFFTEKTGSYFYHSCLKLFKTKFFIEVLQLQVCEQIVYAKRCNFSATLWWNEWGSSS